MYREKVREVEVLGQALTFRAWVCLCVVPGLCLPLTHSTAAMLDGLFKEALCWEHAAYQPHRHQQVLPSKSDTPNYSKFIPIPWELILVSMETAKLELLLYP